MRNRKLVYPLMLILVLLVNIYSVSAINTLFNSGDVYFDNTISNINASNVQDAIVEINNKVNSGSSLKTYGMTSAMLGNGGVLSISPDSSIGSVDYVLGTIALTHACLYDVKNDTYITDSSDAYAVIRRYAPQLLLNNLEFHTETNYILKSHSVSNYEIAQKISSGSVNVSLYLFYNNSITENLEAGRNKTYGTAMQLIGNGGTVSLEEDPALGEAVYVLGLQQINQGCLYDIKNDKYITDTSKGYEIIRKYAPQLIINNINFYDSANYTLKSHSNGTYVLAQKLSGGSIQTALFLFYDNATVMKTYGTTYSRPANGGQISLKEDSSIGSVTYVLATQSNQAASLYDVRNDTYITDANTAKSIISKHAPQLKLVDNIAFYDTSTYKLVSHDNGLFVMQQKASGGSIPVVLHLFYD